MIPNMIVDICIWYELTIISDANPCKDNVIPSIQFGNVVIGPIYTIPIIDNLNENIWDQWYVMVIKTNENIIIHTIDNINDNGYKHSHFECKSFGGIVVFISIRIGIDITS